MPSSDESPPGAPISRWLALLVSVTLLIPVLLTGLRLSAEARTTIRGTVVAREIVAENPVLVGTRYGVHSETAPDRHVLLIRTEGSRAALPYDVPASFWNAVHERDHVRRERGVWSRGSR